MNKRRWKRIFISILLSLLFLMFLKKKRRKNEYTQLYSKTRERERVREKEYKIKITSKNKPKMRILYSNGFFFARSELILKFVVTKTLFKALEKCCWNELQLNKFQSFDQDTQYIDNNVNMSDICLIEWKKISPSFLICDQILLIIYALR